MKLNNLSRLTALLLALMIATFSVAVAESTGMEQTGSDYEILMGGGACGEDNANCTLLTTLRGMEASERYDYLLGIFEGSEEGSTTVAGAQYHHYFMHYQKNTDTDLLCICNMISEDGIFEGYPMAMFPYGDENHLDDCPWKNATEGEPTLVQGLNPIVDEEGKITGYELALVDANGNLAVVATTDILDEKYFYFKDVNSGLYVAYLHEEEDAEGNVTQWIIPLLSENDKASEAN